MRLTQAEIQEIIEEQERREVERREEEEYNAFYIGLFNLEHEDAGDRV